MQSQTVVSPPAPELTERQLAVLDGIDRRLPLKVVAAELGISESRVNQHVKALKDIYGVHSLPDLIEAWREGGEDPCRKPAWRNRQVPRPPVPADHGSRVVPGEFVLADAAAPLAIEAPWLKRHEPRVVPGVLDGDHAVLIRLAVIIGLAFGIIAALVLVMTASLNLSEAMRERGSAPSSSNAPGG